MSNLDPRHSDEDQKLSSSIRPGSYPANPAPGESTEQNHYGGEGAPKPHFPEGLHQVPTSEPAWTEDGSYMVVRVSDFETRGWDKATLNDQEHTVGRFKFSGASLDLEDKEEDLDKPPAFEAEQTKTSAPVNAHIRKANPRGGGVDLERRIFRRGYPLIGPQDSGGVRRGLIFVAFGRTITTQFEFIVRAWMRNPNFPFPGAGVDPLFGKVGDTVLGGGYYFVPPLEKENPTLDLEAPVLLILQDYPLRAGVGEESGGPLVQVGDQDAGVEDDHSGQSSRSRSSSPGS